MICCLIRRAFRIWTGPRRLADCVEAGEPIGVFGDYDVDGAAAAALLVTVMRELGVAVEVHIPTGFARVMGRMRPAAGAQRSVGQSCW